MGDGARRMVSCHEIWQKQNPYAITHIPQPSHETLRLWTMSGVSAGMFPVRPQCQFQAIQLWSCQGCEVGEVGEVGKVGEVGEVG